MRFRGVILTACVATSLFVGSVASGGIFVVLNTMDSGPGSLRQAILGANGLVGGDSIVFAIPAADPNCNATTHVCTITPAAALPMITDPVTIDGYTQPGASANTLAIGDNAVLLIELNGTSAKSSGLTLGGLTGGSTIRGLVINRFGSDFYDSGIFLESGNNIIAGNFIGTDPTGNSELSNFSGVRVATGANNLIGGTVPAARNIISGNNFQSGNVVIEPRFGSGVPTPSGTLIRGNYIGTTAAGTAALHPQAFGNSPGVQIVVGSGTLIGGTDADDGALDGNVGARNVISGNIDGITTKQTSVTSPVNLTVQGNFIGVDATGTIALGNFGYGIFFTPPPDSGIVVGGTAAGAGNVISGNGGVGVLFFGRRLVLQGNRIGTDLAGTLNLGNGNTGVETAAGINREDTDFQMTIGGTTPGAGNIISGNGSFGMRLSGAYVTGAVTVQGNYIGTKGDGLSALGNRFNGIQVQTTATIGGTTAGAGNVIAFNYTGAGVFSMPKAGILVPPSQSDPSLDPRGVAILGNSMFGNGGIGIALGGEGPIPNDLGDADNGPNNRQNFPVLTSSRSTPGGINVIGTLNSRPTTTYRIEFFGNTEINSSTFGEGRTFLGFINVTTDGNGNASFDAPIASGGLITSTATDPNGNTSEFSQSIGQLLNISTRLRVRTGDNVLIGGFIVTGTDSKKVLLRGIGPSLSSSVQGALQDPTLELRDGAGGLIDSNDNWKTKPAGSSQQAEIEATTIAPKNDLESAILANLPANNAAYTAIVRGKNDSIGIGLVEAYDLDQAATSRLANISTRGSVETGNDVLIGGFIAGPGSVRVIVRAIGPSLANQGVSGVLQDPILDVRNVNGSLVRSNDNWRSDQEAEIIATTIPPTNDKEAAVVATLPPGPYTAVVRGKNDTTGVGLVEVYNLP